MERLLHYVWKNKLMPRQGLKTTDGLDVVVLSPGLHNKNAGPDFFSADIVIEGEDWMGNVEIHMKSSDWFRHGHDKDKAYNNVVLHVVEEADVEVFTESGRKVPQMIVEIPESVVSNYESLQAFEEYPPCYQYAEGVPKVISNQWINYLCEERLERKSQEINARVELCEGNWEAAFFITLARTFGFGVNGDAFEEWARTIPFNGVAKHRDDLLQIEAMFFGQAGMLDDDWLKPEQARNALSDKYYQRLRQEYKFLANKFSLTPIANYKWKFLRLRPQNFPTIRMAQFASLYFEQKISISAIVDAENVKQVRELLKTNVSDYWRKHYSFCTEEGLDTDKQMSKASLDIIVLNAVIITLYAYGRYRSSKSLTDKALQWLHTMDAEDNKYTRLWQDMGQKLESAADSQAVIQMFTRYCERRDCLRCQLGYQYIKNNGTSLTFLREDEDDFQI